MFDTYHCLTEILRKIYPALIIWKTVNLEIDFIVLAEG